MKDWFSTIASSSELPPDVEQELHDTGFVVIPGPVPSSNLAQLAAAYDAAVSSADPKDVGIGGTTTRVSDFVNRGAAFDEIYIHPPILAACCRVIDRPFKLSTMHARTVNPNSPPQGLHVDFAREEKGWPMVGFILMIDEFREENGATRFLPGSHRWRQVPVNLTQGSVDYEGEVSACGSAGSVIVYNGSIWHGHGANRTSQPRRSIQGAYIHRDATSGANLSARMLPETLARISPLAKYLLAV